MRWSVGIMLLLVGCSAQSKQSSAPRSKAETVPVQKEGRGTPDISILFYPAIGVSAIAEIWLVDAEKVIRTTRFMHRGVLATWTRRLREKDSQALVGLVDAVLAARLRATACPRRQGRDGVSWSVHQNKKGWHYTLDYDTGGGSECQELESRIRALVNFGGLQCGARYCLREEEQRTGLWSCAPDRGGEDCLNGNRRIE